MGVTQVNCTLGCDPEVFVREIATGRIVAGEEALKRVPAKSNYYGSIVPDGVQVEFHPTPDTCMTTTNTGIANSIRGWGAQLREKGLRLDFTQTIELTQEEIKKLPESARQLGCQPSFNIYDASANLGVDGSYSKRSAGGHIHIGFEDLKERPIWSRRADIVPLLDILLGNTCVLLDRDENAALRRQVYGRAGEYRLPKYGLEYRTLSNFWLRSFPLFNFVHQMARSAFQTAVSSIELTEWDHSTFPATMIARPPEKNFAGELLALVDLEKIRTAINENSFSLAMENFLKIRPWIEENFVETRENSPFPGGSFPLSRTKIDDFLFFVEKGLDYWFGTDPFQWWTDNWVTGSYHYGPWTPGSKPGTSGYHDPAHSKGWNSFLLEVVRVERTGKGKHKYDIPGKMAELIAQGPLVAAAQLGRVEVVIS